jgi:antitoxin MazE
MKVGRWGNSLAVRLPRAQVSALGLKAGDDIRVEVVKNRDLVTDTTERQARLVGLRRLRGLVPADFRFRRYEDVESD